MAETMIQRFESLVDEGAKLTPLGGFDFSGYNARMQDKYLAWRKACLESLEVVGPIGFPYKNKITGDANGGLFYQASANLIYTSMRELFEKLKATPELAAEPVKAASPAPLSSPSESQPQGAGGPRTLRPPVKSAAPPEAAAPVQAAAPPTAPKKAYVIGEINDPLRQQIAEFLSDVGVEEIPIDRSHGEMIALETISREEGAQFAFFVLNSDDLAYAMFELGHFVGNLGKNHVMVLHMTDVEVPKNIPGVVVKPIVVKLEEASLSIIKELKSAGYALTF
ncbi:MAG: nucleotide-binding protein [Ignavibacteriales bacterium]|nr:nucleotide-binding protein [Ignavibacteriales bacterium]